MKQRSSRRPLAADILLGAAAGVAATWVMDIVTTAIYERQPKDVRRHEDEARGGKTAYVIAAEKGAKAVGKELSEADAKTLGSAIHWALGASAGAIYGAVRNCVPRLGIGSGLGYGLLFWLAMDEAALALLGLTPPPKAFPWQAHARGGAGHLALGAVIEAAFDAADLVAP